jgi:Tfp pilus assembly protein FimT
MRIASRTNRRAFTLVEIILVVVIIMIVTAISIPVISSMLTDARSTAAGDMLRGRLAEARARAMEEGRPWRLAYIPGTGVLQIAPEESEDWEQMGQDEIEKADLIRSMLPTDIVLGTTMEEIVSNTGSATPGDGWETIAIYLPAGDARADHTAYFGKTGFYPRRVVLRGVTGVPTIEDINPRALP